MPDCTDDHDTIARVTGAAELHATDTPHDADDDHADRCPHCQNVEADLDTLRRAVVFLASKAGCLDQLLAKVNR